MIAILAAAILGLHSNDCPPAELERAQVLLAEGFDRDAALAALLVINAPQSCRAGKVRARALLVRATTRSGERRQIVAQAKRYFWEAERAGQHPLVVDADRDMAITLASVLHTWAADGQGCIGLGNPNSSVEELAPLYLKRYGDNEGANLVAFALGSALARNGDMGAAAAVLRRVIPALLSVDDREHFSWLTQRVQSAEAR